MICRHCGKEYSDEFAYCPYCAEPKPIEMSESQELKQYTKNILSKFVMKLALCFLFSIAFFAFLMCVEGITIAVFLSIVVFLFLSLIPILEYYTLVKPGRLRTINIQFSKDQTSICPKCGSHNIKIYRKGYDYGKGLVLRLLDVKGAGFSAGIDSNNTCCRCMNCGNDWETDYDYRLIKK